MKSRTPARACRKRPKGLTLDRGFRASRAAEQATPYSGTDGSLTQGFVNPARDCQGQSTNTSGWPHGRPGELNSSSRLRLHTVGIMYDSAAARRCCWQPHAARSLSGGACSVAA